MKFGLLLLHVIVLSSTTDGLFRQLIFDDGPNTVRKLRQKASRKYHHLRNKISNNRNRYQQPIPIADASRGRTFNRASTSTIATASADENMYSTSTIAESYCRDFGPTSSLLLFAYRGSCYSMTSQTITWPDANQLCRDHFRSTTTSKNESGRGAGGLTLFEDEAEFDYVGQMFGQFNRSAGELSAYVGFNYRNQSWLWLDDRQVDFHQTPPSVVAPNNLIFPYQQQKPCGKVELLRPNTTTGLFGLMQQECTKPERALCKIEVDRCFENDRCGSHGICHNDETTFHCECEFLYDGVFCDQYSSEAMQVIAASLLVTIACIAIAVCKRSQKSKENRRRREILQRHELNDDYPVGGSSNCLFRCLLRKFRWIYHSSPTKSSSDCKKMPPPLPVPRPHAVATPSKRHRPKPLMDGLLTFVQSFLTVTVAGIAIVYICVQRTSAIYDHLPRKSSSNHTTKKSFICHFIGSNYINQNVVMLPFSFLLTVFLFVIHQTMIISNVERRKKCFLQRLSFPIIVNPFQKTNRFHTIIVFAVISNQLIILLYEVLLKPSINLQLGILFDLVRRLGLVILCGARYFPIFLSLNIHCLSSTFLTSIFVTFDLILSVYCEAHCITSASTIITSIFVSSTSRAELDITRIHYILFKCLPHYIFLGHVLARFYGLTLRHFLVLCRGNSDRWGSSSLPSTAYHTTSIEYDDDWYYTKALITNRRKVSSGYYLYAQPLHSSTNSSSVKKLFNRFYQSRPYFRFSLLVLFTYTVAFLVLYYLTCLLIFSNTFTLRFLMTITGNVILKFVTLSSSASLTPSSLERVPFTREIFISALLAFFIYTLQLLFGLKQYQSHMLAFYRGQYDKTNYTHTSSCILQRSFHYSGYQVGYVAYGFVILNYILFLICLFFKLLFIHPILIKIVIKFIAPLFILFALKHVIFYCLTKYFFFRMLKSAVTPNRRPTKTELETKKRQHEDQAIYCESIGSSLSFDDDHHQQYQSNLFTLENRHAYFLFVYFNFFFDCFLGIVSCILRLFKSIIALLIFLPRLNYSVFGRNLEQIDSGYTAYTSYIYVEAMHSHPVLIAFTQIVFMNILDARRRRRLFMSDEKEILERQRRLRGRFRWFFAKTLMNNLSLIPLRRHRRKLTKHQSNETDDKRRQLSDSSLSNRTVSLECGNEELT